MEELDQIYQKIDQLEKREIEIKKLMNYKDHYFYFLLIGMIFLKLASVQIFKVKIFSIRINEFVRGDNFFT